MTPPVLTEEILDIVEQLEDAVSLNGVIDIDAVNIALGIAPRATEEAISRLLEGNAIERSAQQPGYILTFAAREGLRERWARSWAEAFWPPDP